MAVKIDPSDVLHEVAARQGWNEKSMLTIALEFLKKHCDHQKFRTFVKKKAKEGNEVFGG